MDKAGEEDSELPSDYGDEEDESSCNSSSHYAESSHITESKKLSSLPNEEADELKSSSRGYPFNEINRIIQEAK